MASVLLSEPQELLMVKKDISAWMAGVVDEELGVYQRKAWNDPELYEDEVDLDETPMVGYKYPSWEVAWLGYYQVSWKSNGSMQAVCLMHGNGDGCGVVMTDVDLKRLRKEMEGHIERDGKAKRVYEVGESGGEVPF